MKSRLLSPVILGSLLSVLIAVPVTAQEAAAPTIKAETYRTDADRIIAAAMASDTGYKRLAYLCDRIGHRLSGSKGLEEAITWAVDEMKRDGLDNVRAEPVKVPHWVRGEESAEITSPVRRPLVMLGLGNSVGTKGRNGIEADAVVVRDFKELDALPDSAVKGKIVVYNVVYTDYGATGIYRYQGASRAAKKGAVGVLVRSISPVSLRTPHTGMLRYSDDAPQIPAAAITIEDVETLARMQARGEKVRVHLKMGAKMLPDALSANVVAELKGREKPEEIVLLGGHFDSWDVGQGAMDDGGCCLAAWEAVRVLKSLGLRPRRTIRVVLFTNEENGVRGGRGYAEAHKAELANHTLAIEGDGGITKPFGFGLSGSSPVGLATAREIGSLLKSIEADRVSEGGGGTDIGPLTEAGVPSMGLSVDETHYFDVHHTQADTFDKIKQDDFARCVATFAVMIYVAAEMPERLGKTTRL
jgi:carboxypeptidase Q